MTIDLILIDVPMPITTPRLLIRPMQAGDGEAVLDFKKDSWNELLPWMILTHNPPIGERTAEDDELFCRQKHIRFMKREDITVLAFDRETEQLIGIGGLHECRWDVPMFTLGFSVRTSETGKGYATEFGTALAKYAFEALSAKRVLTNHADGNIGSQKVIEKMGFEKEGVLRNHHALFDKVVDEHHYGILTVNKLPELDVSWGGKSMFFKSNAPKLTK